MSRRSLSGSDYACQYRPGSTIIHRLPSGWKILICSGLCLFALLGREPLQLLVAASLTLLFYFLAGLTPSDLWRDTRFFLVQFLFLVALFLLERGYPAGLWQGLKTSLQIVLFFIPGIVFLRTTQASGMMKGMRRVVPYRVLFLLFTSLRFVPYFTREIREIAMAQRLRGAELSLSKIFRSRHWGDPFFCLIIPLLVRAMKTAHEAALSAEARGMGLRRERSYYDEEELERYILLTKRETPPSQASGCNPERNCNAPSN
jgi:energy-coupling factor transporter transmembrane protein EcfT